MPVRGSFQHQCHPTAEEKEGSLPGPLVSAFWRLPIRDSNYSYCPAPVPLSQPQVMQPEAMPGALRVSGAERWPAARPGVRSWTLRHCFAAVDITGCLPLLSGYLKCPVLGPSRHKDRPATSFSGLFQMASGLWGKPSRGAPNWKLWPSCPVSANGFPFPLLSSSLPVSPSLSQLPTSGASGEEQV